MKVAISPELKAALMAQRAIDVPAGTFDVHEDSVIEAPVGLHAGGTLVHQHPVRIGAFTYTNSPILGVRSIGRYSSIAGGCIFAPGQHTMDWISTSPFSYQGRYIFGRHLRLSGRPFTRRAVPEGAKNAHGSVVVGNDVWIGDAALINNSITIADGAVIGGRAVITRDVGPYEIWAGNPARLIRKRFPEDLIARLLEVKWWRFDYVDLDKVDFADPASAVEAIAAMEAAGTIRPYEPPPIRLADLAAALTAEAPGPPVRLADLAAAVTAEAPAGRRKRNIFRRGRRWLARRLAQ